MFNRLARAGSRTREDFCGPGNQPHKMQPGSSEVVLTKSAKPIREAVSAALNERDNPLRRRGRSALTKFSLAEALYPPRWQFQCE